MTLENAYQLLVFSKDIYSLFSRIMSKAAKIELTEGTATRSLYFYSSSLFR